MGRVLPGPWPVDGSGGWGPKHFPTDEPLVAIKALDIRGEHPGDGRKHARICSAVHDGA